MNDKLKSWIIQKGYGRESQHTKGELLLYTNNPPIAVTATRQMIVGYMVEYLIDIGGDIELGEPAPTCLEDFVSEIKTLVNNYE